MAVPLILKRTSVPGRVPTLDNVYLGEVAFNTYDGKIYIRRSQSGTDSIVEITGGVRSVNGISGEHINIITDYIPEGSVNLYYHDYLARAAINAGVGIAYDSSTGTVSLNATTTLVPEGSNLYFTTARARESVSGGTGIIYDSVSGVITLDTAVVRAAISAGTGIAYDSVNGVVSLNATTTLVPEGTNLYFTTSRARESVSGGTGIIYNSTSGVITLDGAVVKSLISAGTGIAYNSNTGVISLNANTDLVPEGSTNLYFTTARARQSVSGESGINYNSSTGVFTLDIPTVRGAISGGTGINYNATTGVITLNTATVRSSISAGVGIVYNSTTGVITNTDLGSSQFIFKNFTDGTNTSSADGNNDTFKFRGSAGVTVQVANDDATHGDNLLISLSSVPNSSLANSSITVNGTTIALGGSGSFNTDSVAEGTTNLYFTTARARASVSQGTGISYNTSTGVITNSDRGSSQNIFKNFTDGSATASADSNDDTFKFRGSNGVTVAVVNDDATHGDNLLISLSSVPNSSLTNSSITVNGTTIALGGSGSFNTDSVAEGTTNLYFTDARARGAISQGSGISYNSSTGVISLDPALWQNFNTSVASPGPLTFPTEKISGFYAHSSTDFPSNYFIGMTMRTAGTVAAQIAFGWDAEEASPTGVYFRVNDDTSTTSAWSAWGRLLTATDGGNYVTFTGTENVSNKTMISTTLQSVKEAVVAIGNTGTAKTINLTNGSFQIATLTGNCTFTMPTLEAGKYFTLLLKTGTGGFTATFTGAKFPDNIGPTITTTANRADLIAFVCDGTFWYGNFVQNYSI